MIKTNIAFILLLFIFLGSCSKFEEPDPGNDSWTDRGLGMARVDITFAGAPAEISISKASLRYNKDFALGMHLDDGAKDIYTHAFHLLHGGTINGTNYPGLTYTDGCGNPVKFKMSTALYSMNTSNEDVHDPEIENDYVKWPQVIEMYKKGWGVYNHGFTSESQTDPDVSIEENHAYVKEMSENEIKDGINMHLFVNPNGDSIFTEAAFGQGYRIAFLEGYDFGKPYFNINQEWSKQDIRMGRTNLYGQISLGDMADEMAALSVNGANYWGSTFSHSVVNASYGYDFAFFKSQMEYIAGKYGESGLDNIWMTTEEEVLDYCTLREEITVKEELEGNLLKITFSGFLPEDLRFYPVTLLVESDQIISAIDIKGASVSSSTGIGSSKAMINLQCKSP